MKQRAIRGPAMTFRGDPFLSAAGEALHYWPDALIRIEDGKIISVEDADTGLKSLPADMPLTHYPDALICPGFIDAHVHYPQMQMIGAFGAELLEWLERYTFVAEQDFADAEHARDVAGRLDRKSVV